MAPLKGELSAKLTEGFLSSNRPLRLAWLGTSPFRGGIAKLKFTKEGYLCIPGYGRRCCCF